MGSPRKQKPTRVVKARAKAIKNVKRKAAVKTPKATTPPGIARRGKTTKKVTRKAATTPGSTRRGKTTKVTRKAKTTTGSTRSGKPARKVAPVKIARTRRTAAEVAKERAKLEAARKKAAAKAKIARERERKLLEKERLRVKAEKAKAKARAKAEQAKIAAALAEIKAERAREKASEKAKSRLLSKGYAPKEGQKKLNALLKTKTATEIAELLGTTARTVTKWSREGLSSKGLLQLRRWQDADKASKAESKNEIAVFNQLLKLAGEATELPSHRSYEKARVGANTIGKMWVKGFNAHLSLHVTDEIVAWITSRPRNGEWPFWQAVAIVSEFGKADVAHQGYRTIYRQVAHPRAGDFTIESTFSTHRSKRKSEVAGEMRQILEDASMAGLRIVVHSVTVYHYKWRSEAQSKFWQSTQRRKRQKLWDKKQSKSQTKPAKR